MADEAQDGLEHLTPKDCAEQEVVMQGQESAPRKPWAQKDGQSQYADQAVEQRDIPCQVQEELHAALSALCRDPTADRERSLSLDPHERQARRRDRHGPQLLEQVFDLSR
jgi:hypothetical protein